MFEDGEIEKQVDISLVEDDDIEEIEYVTATLTLTSPTPPDDKVYVDTNRMSSRIYILDCSCNFFLFIVYPGFIFRGNLSIPLFSNTTCYELCRDYISGLKFLKMCQPVSSRPYLDQGDSFAKVMLF